MGYKNPIGRYRSAKRYSAAPSRPRSGSTPARQCGQGIVNGDERYCPACGKFWPKIEDHP